MITVICRECVVLLIGVGVSLLASLFGNAGRDFGALAAAILLPIVFCLIRAIVVQFPRAKLSLFWRGSYQITIALALISLLIFEMGVAMFAGAGDIPVGAWSVVVGFGENGAVYYHTTQHGLLGNTHPVYLQVGS